MPLITALAVPVFAQGYPSKPMRLVLPYPPGGGTDIIARSLAQLIGAGMGQPMVVDNRGGAGGNIGMDAVAKSPPDGYTLVFAITAQLAVREFRPAPGLSPPMALSHCR